MKFIIFLALLYPAMLAGRRKNLEILDACYHQLAEGFPFEFSTTKYDHLLFDSNSNQFLGKIM